MMKEVIISVSIFYFLAFATVLQSSEPKAQEEKSESAPNIEIVESNSLQGFTAFAVIPQYWASAFPLLKAKADQLVTKELEKIGTVIRVGDDPTGFGNSQARITININNITLMNQKNPSPILQTSLSISATVEMKRVSRDSSALI